ncbi:hypothetical protein [Rhizosaccharibacter radicis]|uniref:Lipoprotein n=1 Tax=Rhizosaccharibacter radicis TaxID=2782605 RepID=A0ABT1VY97_9PROT|nr:hypothetical protein [Acetobacteraceae bacterium KSS12]
MSWSDGPRRLATSITTDPRHQPGCVRRVGAPWWLLLTPGLGGCVPATIFPLTAGLGTDVAVFHRTLPDLAYSAITGKDCSLVRLDRDQSYCKPVEPPVPPQPFCTRSLGRIDCWAEPALLADHPAQVAQGPDRLTPDQDRARLARWPAELTTPSAP